MSSKKAATKKTKAKNTQSFMDKVEGSIIGQPIAIANKTFLASLGLIVSVSSDVSKKIDELAKDGETVRDEYQASFEKFRKDMRKRADERRKRAAKRARSFAESIADSFPLATDSDVQELEDKIDRKLDKVLVEVAK